MMEPTSPTESDAKPKQVLLICPPITKAERYSSSIGEAGGSQPPLGVLSLAAYLRQRACGVDVIDGEATGATADEIAARVAADTPDLVGISATTVAVGRAIAVAQAIRSAQADIPIVIGGPHASALPESLLNEAPIDYVVRGEGEHTLIELLDVLDGRRDPADVLGLGFRDSDGKAVVNPPRERIDDLDALPWPAYDLLPDLAPYTPPPCNYQTLPVMSVITSRGCPNACTFCDRSTFGRTLRQRSARNIADEIIHLRKQFGVREIAFVDDTFTINPQRIYELFGLLEEADISIDWTCMSRVNTVDEDLLRFMRDRGCWHISFGIESGSPEILKRIKKNIDLEQVEHVLGICRRLGIRTKGFFIMGHPGETHETLEATIELALRLPLSDIVSTLNSPLPGAEQYATAARTGEFRDGHWREFNCWNPVYVPEGLTADALREKQRELYRRFYLRLPIMWRYARQTFSRGGVKRAIQLAKGLPFLFTKKG